MCAENAFCNGFWVKILKRRKDEKNFGKIPTMPFSSQISYIVLALKTTKKYPRNAGTL